ncbi:unnamed protein product [Phytophthora lilii]|uniref:Unnamed protein product n=1 Tax=Phytophthora lilii TaxID=2077276 RepID=A0A9W6X7I2_9STRA|nr:unnamed protein product [Phytophthora lilii]
MTFNLISIIDNEHVDASSYVSFHNESRDEIEFENEEFDDILDIDWDSVPCTTPSIPLKERVFDRAFSKTLRCNLRETIYYPIWMRDAYMDDPYEMDLYFNEELHKSLLKIIKASDLIVEGLATLNNKKIFREQICEEIIASAMHPSRMMKQMQQFDDIEDFFESMGC